MGFERRVDAAIYRSASKAEVGTQSSEHGVVATGSSVDNYSFGIPDFEPLLNSHQAAQLLDIHHKTLQKLARRGEIHGSQVGKMWRFRASDLNAWLDRQQRAS
ncbi:MAG: helix-turn-helix domain-containing protein [Acidobacteriales bacterium]|nr:helix-turn-helix domain-containing protein [Terriglobales bacterium]